MIGELAALEGLADRLRVGARRPVMRRVRMRDMRRLGMRLTLPRRELHD